MPLSPMKPSSQTSPKDAYLFPPLTDDLHHSSASNLQRYDPSIFGDEQLYLSASSFHGNPFDIGDSIEPKDFKSDISPSPQYFEDVVFNNLPNIQYRQFSPSLNIDPNSPLLNDSTESSSPALTTDPDTQEAPPLPPKVNSPSLSARPRPPLTNLPSQSAA